MNTDLQDTIQQADRLIKQGQFKSAWRLLLPFQDDAEARKRLIWLKRRQGQRAQGETVQQTSSATISRRRSALYFAVFLIGILVVGFALIYSLNRPTTGLPDQPVTEPTAIETAIVSNAPVATVVPPTEPAQEVSLQQQLRDWFMTVEGVNDVLSLDIDVPNDEPPLVYAEIGVMPGYNDTRIPNMFVEKLMTIFDTPSYSDFVVIVNDGTQTVEYILDSETTTWQETAL